MFYISSCGSDYEDYCFPGHNAVQVARLLWTFRRKLYACTSCEADLGNRFLRNVANYLSDCTVSCLRRQFHVVWEVYDWNKSYWRRISLGGGFDNWNEGRIYREYLRPNSMGRIVLGGGGGNSLLLHSGARSERKNHIARTELSFFLVSNSISSFLSRLIYTCQIYVASQGSHFRFEAGNYNLHLNSSISSRFLEDSAAPSPISCSSSHIDMIIWSVFFFWTYSFQFWYCKWL
jgi:hypothetical protein